MASPLDSLAQALTRLSKELTLDVEQLAQITKDLERTNKEGGRGRPSLPYLLALGKLLHDLYSVMEKALTKIAKDLNGGVPQGEDWHRRLLDQMAMDLPGIRPAVISKEFIQHVKPYLGFRHIFRNLYAPQLEWDRMQPLITDARAVSHRFAREMKFFQRFLRSAAR